MFAACAMRLYFSIPAIGKLSPMTCLADRIGLHTRTLDTTPCERPACSPPVVCVLFDTCLINDTNSA